MIDLLVILPNPHFEAPTCPFTPKMMQVKERTPIPNPSIIFTFGHAIECIKEFGVHHTHS